MVLNDTERAMIKQLLLLNFKFDDGGYHGDEFAEAHKAVDEWIMSLPCNLERDIPGHEVPLPVRKAIVKKFFYSHGISKAASVIELLKFYGSYYGFAHANMFHGVEPDGYIHT